MRVHIATDHVGFEIKEVLKKLLAEEGYEIVDHGAHEHNPDDDYPDFIRPCAEAVAKEKGSFGIIMGGSGQGEVMVANRTPGVRAALCYGPQDPVREVDVSGKRSTDPYEIVRLAREHNNANVLSLGVRFLTDDEMKKIVTLFIQTPFSGALRHERRVQKIDGE